MKASKGFSRLFWTLCGIIFLFFIWEISSRFFDSFLIFPGPLSVLKSLGLLLADSRFYYSLWNSFLRVLGGILIAVPLGIGAGIAAGLNRKFAAFISPFFSIISATPVISVILIAFLFLGAARTPVFAAFLMVFPVVSANIIEGIKNTNTGYRELFISFRMNRMEKIKYLYFPALLPFIFASLKSSLSLCWKVVIAAEVIVQPLRSLGTGMQFARMNLETSELFAWTIATIIAAVISNIILSIILKKIRVKNHEN